MSENVVHGHAPHSDEAHDAHHGHDNSPEAIRKEVRKYLLVLVALGMLTIITVGISYIHLPTGQAVALALVVATVKGSLVAAFFMHLISERKLIYAVLIFTVFFFGLLLWAPWQHRSNARSNFGNYDDSGQAPATTSAPHHDSGH